MLFTPAKLYRTPEHIRRHQDTLAALKRMEAASRLEGDPWLFHGTSLLAASWIVAEGFNAASVEMGPADKTHRLPEGRGVHWGTANVAGFFARKRSYCHADDHAVFLRIRASELQKVATLHPDWFCLLEVGIPIPPYDEYGEQRPPLPEDPDWRASLETGGACVSVGATIIPGVELINPNAGAPPHPYWREHRARRLDDNGLWAGLPRPHPDLVEDTPDAIPCTMTMEEADAIRDAHYADLLAARAARQGPTP